MNGFTEAVKRVGAVSLACAGFLIMTGTSAGQNSDSSDKVTVEGCPVPGVEGGCLVITGNDGKLWDISSAKPRPKVGDRAILLAGRKSSQPSVCMQGTRLDQIEWHYMERKCPKPQEPE